MICSGCGREDILCPTCMESQIVPKSKIHAKIKELRKMLRDNHTIIPYERQWIIVSIAIPALEELLYE